MSQDRFVNVRRILLKHKRASKIPLLDKFVKTCFKENENSYVATSDAFQEYQHVLSIWTDGDSDHGQTSVLIKEKAFHRVSYS